MRAVEREERVRERDRDGECEREGSPDNIREENYEAAFIQTHHSSFDFVLNK